MPILTEKNNRIISYNNKISYGSINQVKYGYLYNWYAANDPLFAPAGWHLPSLEEYSELKMFVLNLVNDDWYAANGSLKEIGLTYWNSPNDLGTNIVNFNARGCGFRDWNNSYNAIKDRLYLYTTHNTDIIVLQGGDQMWSQDWAAKFWGLSVRLIKDDSTLVSSLADVNGNIYRTTKIGNQVWLADNWACNKLRNGITIPNVTNNTAWGALTTGACCTYNNDISNVFIQ